MRARSLRIASPSGNRFPRRVEPIRDVVSYAESLLARGLYALAYAVLRHAAARAADEHLLLVDLSRA